MERASSRCRVVLCEALDDYTRLAASLSRESTDIPLLQNGHPWPLRSIDEDVATVSFSSYSNSAPITGRGHSTLPNRLHQGDGRSRTIVTHDGLPAYAATVLAASLGERLEVVSGSGLCAHVCKLYGERPVIVVADISEIGDALILSLLEQFRTSLADLRPWDTLPQVTFVTGRDFASLTWVVAKILLKFLTGRPLGREIRISRFNGYRENCMVSDWRRNSSGVTFGSRLASHTEALDAITRPAAAVAHAGHGRDACSNLGSGVWLCGRRLKENSPRQPGRATLACGVGHPCLRGPYPIELSKISAEILMLASCSSFRLADSSLSSDFSLILEFLDGPGRGYMGSIRFQVPGAAAEAFLSATASGLPLAEATNFVNAYATQSELDAPTFVSVGHPADCVLEPRSILGQTSDGSSSSHVPLNCCAVLNVAGHRRETNALSVLFSHEEVVEAAKAANLVFSIHPSDGGEPIKWFYRLERTPGDQNSGQTVRAFFFRFPEPFTSLSVTPRDRTCTLEHYFSSMRSLNRWSEFLSVSGLRSKNERLWNDVSAACQGGRDFIGPAAFHWKHNGGTLERIEQKRRDNLELCRRTAYEVMRLLLPDLSHVWFLSHALGNMSSYRPIGTSECLYCGNRASLMIATSPQLSEPRALEICPHCATTLDTQLDGFCAEIVIEAPPEIHAGASLEGCVRVTLNPNNVIDGQVLVSTRIGAPGLPGLTPWREVTTREPAAELLFPFQFDIPGDIPPRQGDLKALVITNDGIAFAQRPLTIY